MRFRTLFSVGFLAMALLVAATGAAAKLGDWSAPVNLGPVVNSPFLDQGPAISPDGLALYFNSNRPGGLGGDDIWVARREKESDPWGTPFNLGAPVNTPFDERVPAFSRDARTLFLASSHPDGFGVRDVWMSQRQDPDDDFGWGPLVNLGSNVNTAADEAGSALFEHGDDAVLIFNSARPGPPGTGLFDLYVSVRDDDGSFGPATLIAELSTPLVEARPTISRDGREIFFTRGPTTAGPFDLWTATRENRRDPWSEATDLGPVVNSVANDVRPWLSRDARTLFFDSARAGGSGAADLWLTTRESGDEDEDD